MLEPVVTIMVNLSGVPWKSPRRLSELFAIDDPEFLNYVNDYEMVIVDPYYMTQEELDKDFSAIKYNKDGNGFEAMFNNFKSILFFSFENVFEFRGHSFKSIDYNKYKNDLLKNFDYLNLENE